VRLPGFVAEASLVGIARSRNRRTASGGARHFRQTRGTITPQQGIRVDALSYAGIFHFFSPCRQRCEHDQQVAHIQCLGECSHFLGPGHLEFLGTCTSNCAGGFDYEFGSKILFAPPELKPGYCDVRCPGLAGRLSIPLHFVRQ
jgi:hypothetical protein